MQQDKSKPIVKVLFNAKDGTYEIKFTDPDIEPIINKPTLDSAMDEAANRIAISRMRRKANTGIHNTKQSISRLEANLKRLYSQLDDLNEQKAKRHPEDSFLDPCQLEAYKLAASPLTPEKINWFEKQFGVTIIGIDFVDIGKSSIYGCELQHAWLFVKNENLKKS